MDIRFERVDSATKCEVYFLSPESAQPSFQSLKGAVLCKDILRKYFSFRKSFFFSPLLCFFVKCSFISLEQVIF